MTKKRERLTKRQVEKRLAKLGDVSCVSEIDARELDYLMWCQPSLVITFCDKINHK